MIAAKHRRPWRLAALAVLSLPALVGCPQEVPYTDPPAETAPEAAVEEAPVFGEGPVPQAEPEPTATETPAEETAATEPSESPQEPPSGRRFWETADPQPGSSSPTPELFSKVESEAESAEAQATAAPEEVDDGVAAQDETDSFAAILEANVSKFGAKPAPANEVAASPPTPKEPTTTQEEEGEQLDDLWGPVSDGPSKAQAEPNVSTESEAPPFGEAIPAAEEPLADSGEESSTTTTPEDLFAPSEPVVAAPSDAPPEPDLPATPAETDEPFALPAEPFPAEDEPVKPEAGEAPAETAEPEKTKPASSLPLAESEEETEPDPLPLPQDAAPAPRRGSPLAAGASQPLPAVPVLSFNTRHMAWLLGGKLGLAELADLDGATPAETAEWRDEVLRLARELQIEAPARDAAASGVAPRVAAVMRSAAGLGQSLGKRHGVDHAALLEIALKTNALLVVADERPDLAGPVAAAVRGAAERAMLPKFLWEDAIRALEAKPTPQAAHDAVVKLHQRVESFLR